MGMVEEIIAFHRFLVDFFAFFVFSGLIIPKITKGNAFQFRKASFIYTMIFHAIAAMAAFTGLVAMVVGKYTLEVSIIFMILIWGVLMFLEIKKYRTIKIAYFEGLETERLLQNLFYKITAVQFFLIVAMIGIKMMEVKGAVSLP
jgi:hypothetical protein